MEALIAEHTYRILTRLLCRYGLVHWPARQLRRQYAVAGHPGPWYCTWCTYFHAGPWYAWYCERCQWWR